MTGRPIGYLDSDAPQPGHGRSRPYTEGVIMETVDPSLPDAFSRVVELVAASECKVVASGAVHLPYLAHPKSR